MSPRYGGIIVTTFFLVFWFLCLSRNVPGKEEERTGGPKGSNFLEETDTIAVSRKVSLHQQHISIVPKLLFKNGLKMMGACTTEAELEGQIRKKRQRRKFSALPQNRLNLRSEIEAVEILGLNMDDYKFMTKEGTKDQVSTLDKSFFQRLTK